ncbi:hypothetical protein [Arthrobacter sp. TMN-50]
MAGGLLMVTLWLIFTTVHGATSFDEDRVVLGGSTLFWGMLLGSIPNLLIAAGMVLLSPGLALTIDRLARIGYAVLLIGLIVPALIDLSIQALGPPFFVPVASIGLVLLASGMQHNPRVGRSSRYLLLSIGLLLAFAFAWALLPSTLTDPIDGYRIHGAFAHFGAGIGWALFGISVFQKQALAHSGPA